MAGPLKSTDLPRSELRQTPAKARAARGAKAATHKDARNQNSASVTVRGARPDRQDETKGRSLGRHSFSLRIAWSAWGMM